MATYFSGLMIGVLALVPPAPKLIWNATASTPAGLYAVRPIGDPQVGDLVLVMPPEPVASFLSDGGYLPKGVPLLKHVAAVPGQRICRLGRAITIDGVVIAAARERDSRGRDLPVWSGCRIIANTEIFLMNADVPDSLDGRYFGPLPAASIIGRATPLWTNDRRNYPKSRPSEN
jgi:conjugative transfer signal peptidase TraF